VHGAKYISVSKSLFEAEE